jgi:DnaJ-class molecular chaperone
MSAPECPACKGSGLLTDPETEVQQDDVCPECGGEGCVLLSDEEAQDRAYGQHDTWAEWRGER